MFTNINIRVGAEFRHRTNPYMKVIVVGLDYMWVEFIYTDSNDHGWRTRDYFEKEFIEVL